MIPQHAEEAEPLHRAARFERHAGFYGVPAAALDQAFTWLGSAYRLSGCAARRCKFPFTAERVSDGKLVKFPCNVVRAAFLAVSGGGPGTNADEDSCSGIEGGPCPISAIGWFGSSAPDCLLTATVQLWKRAMVVDRRLDAIIPSEACWPVPGLLELLHQASACEQALSAHQERRTGHLRLSSGYHFSRRFAYGPPAATGAPGVVFRYCSSTVWSGTIQAIARS